MTAQEAREITFNSKATRNDFTDLTSVYNRIKTDAENVNTHSVFFGAIPDNMKNILERDGFEIRILGIDDPQPMTKIKW